MDIRCIVGAARLTYHRRHRPFGTISLKQVKQGPARSFGPLEGLAIANDCMGDLRLDFQAVEITTPYFDFSADQNTRIGTIENCTVSFRDDRTKAFYPHRDRSRCIKKCGFTDSSDSLSYGQNRAVTFSSIRKDNGRNIEKRNKVIVYLFRKVDEKFLASSSN